MPFTQLFYHFVWTIKNREPILELDVERILFDHISTKVHNLDGKVFALNGWKDHVHLIVSIHPTTAVSKFIGQVKADSTSQFNKTNHPIGVIYWQEEYSVFSLDKKRLKHHIEYVKNQKQHHEEGNLIPILEKIKRNQYR